MRQRNLETADRCVSPVSFSGATPGTTGTFGHGTARDSLVELLQNARRAGAGRVSVDIVAEAEGARLVVRDDVVGVADPALLFALGASGWDDAILVREDPAGMGVFSLAGRAVLNSRAAYDEAVHKGVRRMPAFDKVLNASQQHDVFAWLLQISRDGAKP